MHRKCSVPVAPAYFSFMILAFTLAGPSGSLAAQETPDDAGAAAPAVERVLARVAEAEGDEFWRAIAQLQSLGDAAVPVLRTRLAGEGEKGRLACAAVLLEAGDDDVLMTAIDTVEALARSGTSLAVRAAAIELLAQHGDIDEAVELLEGILEDSLDPSIQIPTARALWELDRVPLAREKLVELLASRDQDVRTRAALALAEIDYFEGPVRDVLRVLKDEPSARGRRAASLYKIMQLSRQLDAGAEGSLGPLEGTDLEKLLEIKERRIRELEEQADRVDPQPATAGPGGPGLAVLEEVILQIRSLYVNEQKVGRKNLIVDALKGMVGRLDDFSAFMDVEETERFRQGLSGEYFGIGAQVHKPPDMPLEIVKPIYGGPAYESGLLSGDLIVEVNGAPTAGLRMEELLERLKGPQKTRVKLSVLRRGWTEPQEFTVERRRVEVPTVNHDLLPGAIGYVQLQQFGDKSADEFIAALDALEDRKMEGLVIDLRNDPGGRLDVAIRIADQFLRGDLPIVTQKGRESGVDEVSTFPDDFTRPPYPIVVLVNERSASAAEIVAGALQDYGRATLLGKRTFGKGSVQRLIPLSNEAREYLGGDSQLRLTVQYYYLPLGDCIHTIREDGAVVKQGGVEPDIEVESEKVPIWQLEERERLRTDPAILDYVDKHAEALKRLYASGGGSEPSEYPDFQKLFETLETTGTEEDVRFVLRYHSRRRLEDENGREFACDYLEDQQLQAAILEMLGKLDKDPTEIPRYGSFVKG